MGNISSFSTLQLNIRMLAYGASIESSSVVTSSPPPSVKVTCLPEEPIPHEVCAIALESVEDAAILERDAIVSLEMGKCAEAKEQLEKVLKFKESYYGCVGSHLASTINSLAEAHFGLGDFLTARRLCVKALETEPDDFTSADVICNLGLAYIAVGRFEEAKVELEEACDRLNRKSALSDCGLLIKAKVLSVLGITYSYTDDVEKAKKVVSNCSALIRSYQVSPQTETKVLDIKCCLGYGLVRTESDDQEKGLEFLESVVVYFESTHSSDHYKYLDALNLLGFSYGLRLGWERGLDILERSAQLAKLHYGDDNIVTCNFFQSLGIAFSALNDNRKAVEFFEKSLKILEQFRHPFYEMARLHSFQFLSQCYVKLQNYEKAKEVLKTSLEIEQKQKSSGRKPTKSTLTLLAKVYLLIRYQRHDIEFLENNLEKEKRLRHRIEFIDDLVISYILLGRAYGAFGDKARETEMNKEALDMEKRRREGLLGNGN